jgi:hypothetical protein
MKAVNVDLGRNSARSSRGQFRLRCSVPEERNGRISQDIQSEAEIRNWNNCNQGRHMFFNPFH